MEIALRVFRHIEAEFPALSMSLVTDHPQVDVMLDIPAQPGLAFDVSLNLQNRDELHIVAPGFWCEWFPCTDPQKEEIYREAVAGLLAGSYRIVETLVGDRVVRAELQRPIGTDWKAIGISLTFSFPWQRKSTRIVQNLPSG